MLRRIHTSTLLPGRQSLGEAEAHHARDVLRVTVGDALELFDDAGRTASAHVVECSKRGIEVEASQPVEPAAQLPIEVVSALPKGDRAEWMIEKLSELGVTHLRPLLTARSVVTARGDNKRDRFRRIAIEAAKQSHRVGVMQIHEPVKLAHALHAPFDGRRLMTTTQGQSVPMARLQGDYCEAPVQLWIGPEGGWADGELAAMRDAGLTGVWLTTTILRIETAAVVAAALVATARRRHEKG